MFQARRWMALAFLLSLAGPVMAAEPPGSAHSLVLTAAEKAWLAAHPVIRIGVDPDFAPYAFIDAQGQPAGVSAELSALVAERLGVRLQLVPGLSWPQILEAARKRDIDVITTATFRPERLEYLKFTRPYLITPLVVMTRVDAPRITDLQQLNGMKVALVKDYASTRTALERFPRIDAHIVPNPLAGLNAVSARFAEAYIGVLGINTYLASRNGISNLKVNAGFDMSNTQSYGVRKDWPELVPLLEKALDSIPAAKQNEVFSRWISVSVESLMAPEEEREVDLRNRIASLPELRVGVLSNRPPFDFVGKDGAYAGLSADILDLLVKKWGLKVRTVPDDSLERLLVRLERDELDVVLGVNGSQSGIPARRLSEPYFISTLGVFVSRGNVFLGEIENLLDRRVALRTGSYAEEILHRHPRIALQVFPTLTGAARAMLDGRAEFLVGETTSTLRELEEAGIVNLRFVGPLSQAPVRLSFTVSPRREDWLPPINQALASISQTEASAVRRRWVASAPPLGLKLQTVLAWTGAGLLLIGIGYAGFIFWNYRLRQEITRRTRALEESEYRLRGLFEHAHDMILILEPESGRILDVNQRATEQFGYSRAELLAMHAHELGPPETAAESDAGMARILSEGHAVFERTLRHKDGTPRFAEVSARMIDLGGKQVIEGFLRDITERKLAEQERERLFRELERRHAEMESFIYSISHDLKTPLVTIDGFSQMLARDLAQGNTENARDSIGEVRKAISGMHRLIEDLLRLSRTGQTLGEPEEVDMPALLEEVKARCAAAIEQTQATIHLVTSIPRLRVDRERFGQVLQNLLDNAIKFHREGVAPVVEIGAERERDEIRLYVRDNGIGIEKRYQEKIFGLFQRLDQRREGTGAGLTIARRIIEQHGGRLTVESEPGKGSIFWISLPDSVIVSDGARHSARENQSPR